MNDGPSDLEIVHGLRCGDREAWDALCHRYGTRVWTYVARLVGRDSEAVGDVYQETFLAVAKGGRNLEPETRIWSWIARVAHNQAALHWRKQYRNPVRSPLADTPATSSDPLETLSRSETVEQIRSLLADMNADYVVLLQAKYMDGLSIAGIAELLGGTHEAIRSRLARARRDFRERYEKQQTSATTKDASLRAKDSFDAR